MKAILLKLPILTILFLEMGKKSIGQITVQNVQKLYYRARASIDTYKLKNNGVSYVGDEDKRKLVADVAVMMFFNLVVGNCGPGHSTPNLINKRNEPSPFLELASVDKGEDLPFKDRYPMKKPNLSGYPYISFGIDYKMKNTNEIADGGSAVYKFQYLQLPLMINYRKPINALSSIHFGIGPYYAYALSAKLTTSEGSNALNLGNLGNDDYKGEIMELGSMQDILLPRNGIFP